MRYACILGVCLPSPFLSYLIQKYLQVERKETTISILSEGAKAKSGILVADFKCNLQASQFLEDVYKGALCTLQSAIR